MPSTNFPPEYFETHFRLAEVAVAWPEQFAIITAWATTGEEWTDEENILADQALEAQLKDLNVWMTRITGYSPTTGYAEPGWAVEITFDKACDLGMQFKQDAIYFVLQDELNVSYCDERRLCVLVDTFRNRVHFP